MQKFDFDEWANLYQRTAVRSLLARDERVLEFSDAPENQGGRGATLVRLRRRSEE